MSDFEGELCADSVADHGERCPGADQRTIAADEAAAVAEAEEGAPDFFDGATVFAQAGSGGQIQYPDADDRKDDQAGDPGVDRSGVVVDAGEQKAADHRGQKSERGGEQLGCRGVGVGVVERHDSDDDGEQDEGDEGVGEKPESLAREVGRSFVLRDVTFERHGCLAKGTSDARVMMRFLITSLVACAE
jgi:hypothetical protein